MSKDSKIGNFVSEKNCLETTLRCVIVISNAFKRRAWISEEITMMVRKVRECGENLMSATSCGNLAEKINNLGEIFSTIELTGIPTTISRTTHTGIIHTTTIHHPWISIKPETREQIDRLCSNLITDIKNRIAELTEEISKIQEIPNPDQILAFLFPDYYENLDCKITANDISILKSYNDADIRTRLVRILKKCDYITRAEKSELKERGELPHTGYEISDLWVYIQLDGLSVRIDFVVKSAKEFSKTVPMNVWDQWTRPVEGISDLSLLISYARTSLPLENRKNVYNNDSNCLRAITGKALAILFKSYNELN